MPNKRQYGAMLRKYRRDHGFKSREKMGRSIVIQHYHGLVKRMAETIRDEIDQEILEDIARMAQDPDVLKLYSKVQINKDLYTWITVDGVSGEDA